MEIKTAAMYVIGFLYVSLGSSTVQLHGSVGSRRACACSEAGFNSQNRDRSWRCTIEDHRSVVLIAKDINKYIFRFTVHNWVEELSQGSSKVTDDARPAWGSGSDNSQKTSMQGFQSTGKAMGQV
jgi:hypothetical protein